MFHRFRTRTGMARTAVGLLVSTLLIATSGRASGEDHFPFGSLSVPRSIPALNVTQADGSSTDLSKMLRGHITALQLMFTNCNAICPLQGAMFSRAQQELGTQVPDAQFISMSIDPANDSPAAMTEWLHTFGARPGWRGVTPKASDVPGLFRVLGDGGLPRPEGADPHSGQVYIVNRNGALIYRTAAMPSARSIVDAMRTAATTGWH